MARKDSPKWRNTLKWRSKSAGKDSQIFARSNISQLALLVTTGLDPVVHADVRLSRPFKEVLQAWLPHGLPGQARQ
jgi:hypothetical protein